MSATLEDAMLAAYIGEPRPPVSMRITFAEEERAKKLKTILDKKNSLGVTDEILKEINPLLFHLVNDLENIPSMYCAKHDVVHLSNYVFEGETVFRLIQDAWMFDFAPILEDPNQSNARHYLKYLTKTARNDYCVQCRDIICAAENPYVVPATVVPVNTATVVPTVPCQPTYPGFMNEWRLGNGPTNEGVPNHVTGTTFINPSKGVASANPLTEYKATHVRGCDRGCWGICMCPKDDSPEYKHYRDNILSADTYMRDDAMLEVDDSMYPWAPPDCIDPGFYGTKVVAPTPAPTFIPASTFIPAPIPTLMPTLTPPSAPTHQPKIVPITSTTPANVPIYHIERPRYPPQQYTEVPQPPMMPPSQPVLRVQLCEPMYQQPQYAQPQYQPIHMHPQYSRPDGASASYSQFVIEQKMAEFNKLMYKLNKSTSKIQSMVRSSYPQPMQPQYYPYSPPCTQLRYIQPMQSMQSMQPQYVTRDETPIMRMMSPSTPIVKQSTVQQTVVQPDSTNNSVSFANALPNGILDTATMTNDELTLWLRSKQFEHIAGRDQDGDVPKTKNKFNPNGPAFDFEDSL